MAAIVVVAILLLSLVLLVNSTIVTNCFASHEKSNFNLNINVSILTISADYNYNSNSYNNSNEFNINGIQKYREYHGVLLHTYALKHNYSLKIMNENNSINYQPDDVRWNKVMMLREALHPIYGWARDSKYVMWIDSDAIVLDLNLNIEDIFENQYPNAHILMSADIRQGLVNSGVVLLRNSPYTRQFLSLWWGEIDPDVYDTDPDIDPNAQFMFNRSIICDQDAFDLVYAKYLRVDRLVTVYQELCLEILSLCEPLPLPSTLHQLVLQFWSVVRTINSGDMNVYGLGIRDNNEILLVMEYWKDPNMILEHSPYYVYNLSKPSFHTDRIMILKMDKLNSYPPALIFQKEHNQFLHLMGESSIYRGVLFAYACDQLIRVCNSNTSTHVFHPQLGLNQTLLLSVGLIVYNHSTVVQLHQLEGSVRRFELHYARFNVLIKDLISTNKDIETEFELELELLQFLYRIPLEMELIFEVISQLSKSSHKLCDIYEYLRHHPDLEIDLEGVCHSLPSHFLVLEGITCNIPNNSTSIDTNLLPLILRKQMFYLLGRVLHAHKHYSNWYSQLFMHQDTSLYQSIYKRSLSYSHSSTSATTAATTTTSDSISISNKSTNIWSHYRSLQTNYLHLLKRVAETGNDLFQISPMVDEKKLIGEFILEEVLTDMLSVIHVDSRHIPLHMMALMHQNLGLMYFIHSRDGEGVRGGEVDMNRNKNKKETIRAGIDAIEGDSESVYQKSIYHLLKSIEIFQDPILLNHRSNRSIDGIMGVAGSPSIKREYIFSLLLYTTLATTKIESILPESCHNSLTSGCYLSHRNLSLHYVELRETLILQGNEYLLGGYGHEHRNLNLNGYQDWERYLLLTGSDSTILKTVHTISVQLLISLYYHSATTFLGVYMDIVTLFHTKADLFRNNRLILLRDCVVMLEKTYNNIVIAQKLSEFLSRRNGDVEMMGTTEGLDTDSTPKQRISLEEISFLWDKLTQSIEVTFSLCSELELELDPQLAPSHLHFKPDPHRLSDKHRVNEHKLYVMKESLSLVFTELEEVRWLDVDARFQAVMEEEEEWEECFEGEEDCEAYEEEEEEMPVLFEVARMVTDPLELGSFDMHVNSNVNVNQVGNNRLTGVVEDEEEDDDDEEDLAEIRERYAQQTARRLGGI